MREEKERELKQVKNSSLCLFLFLSVASLSLSLSLSGRQEGRRVGRVTGRKGEEVVQRGGGGNEGEMEKEEKERKRTRRRRRKKRSRRRGGERGRGGTGEGPRRSALTHSLLRDLECGRRQDDNRRPALGVEGGDPNGVASPGPQGLHGPLGLVGGPVQMQGPALIVHLR